MPRGGRRTGRPGASYPNRTDLSFNKGPVANTPYPTGGSIGYGDQKALADAQRAVPVSSPTPPSPPTGPAGGPPGLDALMGAQGPPPGAFGDFARPTERPGEPVTHGLPTGPGGGPEVMSAPAQRPAASLLAQLSRSPFATDDIRNLLARLQR